MATVDREVGRLVAELSDDTVVLVMGDRGVRLVETRGAGHLWGQHLVPEMVHVPLLVRVPSMAGRRVDAPVSLVDIYPTAVEGVGATLNDHEQTLPGDSLVRMAGGYRPERTVLSEYHDGGSITGFFMIRHGQWKYIHYAGYDPQLFNLDADPDELSDLGTSPDHADVRAECEVALRAVVDPDAVNARAFADQADKIAALGGEDAVRNMATFGYTPVPGAT